MNKIKKSGKRPVLYILTVLLAVFFVVFTGAYLLVAPNFVPEKTYYIYVYPDRNFDRLCRELEDSAHCRRILSFIKIAEYLKYPDNMKTGRYAVTPGMSNIDLLKTLRRGTQEPVRITFNNIRTVEDLAERLSAQLMVSSEDLMALLGDPDYCSSMGFTRQTVPSMFIPNTYEIYWNVSAENLLQRMMREYAAFWTDTRMLQAQKIGLSPLQVSILASIVEEESAAADEYPIIAGLYINRLHRGMPLQADPTVKFALGDVTLQRILNEHLTVDSPYNTYLHTGLPPGPLRIPSITGLEAVLNYRKHNFLYMCAKEDFSGRHSFAATLAEHNRNADRYRSELNRKGIW
ncbi:MAG: endolytic transglycosylase MltG [Tannerella sp.]|nr:endolytic transglycosylase MltG [Tannerella sp.]